MIDKYIAQICAILGIAPPAISFDTSHFATQTMMAQCSPDGSTIHIKKMKKPSPDYFFAVAHELRHVWQIRTDREFWLSNYRPADALTVDQYNNQPAEIDANAFALVVMATFFDLQPQFNGLSDAIKARIHERAKEIANGAD